MKKALPVFLLLLASSLLSSVTLIFPFGRDQGIHAFIADSMLHGKVVYRDVFNVKPPLTTFVHALSLLIFGHSMTAIRLFDLLWTMATAYLLYLFTWRAFRRRWLAVTAGLFYSLQYNMLDFWHTAQTDAWLNLPATAAMLFALVALNPLIEDNSSFRASYWLMAGISCGLVALFKYPAGILLLGLVLIILLFNRRSNKLGLSAIFYLALGGFLTTIAAGTILLFSGALPAFLESQFGLMPDYVKLGSEQGLFKKILSMMQGFTFDRNFCIGPLLGFAGLGPALTFIAQRKGKQVLPMVLVLVWLGAGFFSLYAQGKFFRYHYLSLLPPLSILGGIALIELFKPVWNQWRRILPRTILLLLIATGILLISPYPERFQNLLAIVAQKTEVRDYWMESRHDIGEDFSLREDIALANYLQTQTTPADRIFIWGYEPLVYFLARRQIVSRFLYNFPLVVRWAPQKLRAEFLQAIQQDPPKLFVIAHKDATPWVTGHNKDSFRSFMEFTELRFFLEENYDFLASVGRFDIYRRLTND